jgi:hypothetical protein
MARGAGKAGSGPETGFRPFAASRTAVRPKFPDASWHAARNHELSG